MNERALTVFEQYELDITETFKIRGNYGCNTPDGKYILQEYDNSNDKMVSMKSLYNHLESSGIKTDYVIPNKEDRYVSVSEDGYTYILKKWFESQECNINEEKHIVMGAANLGRFHTLCQNSQRFMEETKGFHPGKNMLVIYEKHNKEIINIRNYIKKRKNKNYFELALKEMLVEYYSQADEALKALRQTSFNAPAFCSYGREQNYNAPVGKYAAFAYTAALNHLLADSDHVQHIGDTTVVCWAEGADDAYPGFFSAVIGGGTYGGLSDNDLRAALKRLANGLPCDDLGVDPNRPFYILGLAPNAARLSVRFFLRDSFGKLMENVDAHYARLEIAGAKYSILPLWALLNATVRDSKKQVPSPVVSGATVRAVFSGTPYPVSLMEAVLLRIRAERNITWGKAAIIKAYYLKNPHEDCPKEVLTVSLNEASTNPAYTLGRLFSVYEAVQQAANPGINATIKDKYFNSAAAMPASIFPVLNNLCQKHLRKLDARQRVYYDKQIMKLKGVLNENYPARMTLAQQGSFDLGYYHQTQKRYTKKEEKENV